MEGGDISDQPGRRIVIVFEDLIAYLPPAAQKAERWYRKRRKWDKAVACWQLNDITRRVIADLVWRRHINVDILTVSGDEAFGEAIERLLDRRAYSCSRVIAATLEQYQSLLATSPEVAAVFFPTTLGVFIFGSRGRAVNQPQDMLGAL